MFHHPFSGSFLKYAHKKSEVASKAASANPPKYANTKKKTTQSEKKEQKEELIQWAKILSTYHVVLNAKRDGVETLGGKNWADLGKEIYEAFVHKNNIAIPQSMRTSPKLGQVVVNHMNA